MNERCYMSVNLDAIKDNYLYIKRKAKKDVICTLKADAYGHGADECVRALSSVGASFFAVATVDEAIRLRRFTDGEILILGYVPTMDADICNRNGIIISLYSQRQAYELMRLDRSSLPRMHIAVNTGMNRLGFSWKDSKYIENIISSGRFDICGIYSHLMDSNSDRDEHSAVQIQRFSELLSQLPLSVAPHMTVHMANSAAVVKYGSLGFDMVRAGIALFGGDGSGVFAHDMPAPATALYARVVRTNRVRRGEYVGYGGDFRATRDCDIVTLSIGYADGIFRSYSGAPVKFCGGNGRIVGRICMDMCSVLLDENVKVSEGEYAALFTPDGKSIDEYAKIAGTIRYEQLTAIGDRVPRIYSESTKE
ncbi:MAG: alanine racemase [Eubacteriales bacterium]|nr:alanine racemase [Eubacteriales bacterium]